MSTQQAKIEIAKIENKLVKVNILYLKEMEKNATLRKELAETKKLLRDAEIKANHYTRRNAEYIDKIDRVLSENVELDNKNLAQYNQIKTLQLENIEFKTRSMQSDMDYSNLANTFFGKLAVKCGGGRR